ncbi:MAG: glycosyltransferase family 87 protein [Halococcoides sp.]
MASIPRHLWQYRRERPLFVAISVVTIVSLLGWLPVEHFLQQMDVGIPYTFNDFSAYTTALHRWLSGEIMYVPNAKGGYFGEFLYPPVTVLFFLPFATTGFVQGAMLFGATSIVMLWVGIEAMARTLGYRLRIWERFALLVAIFAFQPAIRNFRWAQTATFLTGFLAFAFYFQERAEADGSLYDESELGDRAREWFKFLSGAFTTLGSSLKLFFATSGAHLLRDRTRFAGAMTAAAALLVLSLTLFGLDQNLQYLDVLMWGKGWGEGMPPYAWDASAAYAPLYLLGRFAIYVKIVGIFTVIGLTLTARDAEAPSARHTTFALGLAAIPLLAPKSESQDLIVLVVPAIVLLANELDRPDGYAWIPVLSVFFVHFHRYVVELTTHPDGQYLGAALLYQFAAVLQPAAWATFMLVGLAAYRVAEHASPPDLTAIRDRLLDRDRPPE